VVWGRGGTGARYTDSGGYEQRRRVLSEEERKSATEKGQNTEGNRDSAYEPPRLGHLSLRPSSQRIYRSSAIGLRRGAFGSSLGAAADCCDERRLPSPGLGADGGEEEEEEEESWLGVGPGVGRPEISSSSVTTRPLLVSSERRTTRLWGKRPRVVWMCWRTDAFLESRMSAHGPDR
jgi:hypothetical protein